MGADREDLSTDAVDSAAVIAATVGIIHDMGNPPFGHAGEESMRSWFRKTLSHNKDLLKTLGGKDSQMAQDFLKFEGNAQTVRLLGKLQILADHHGLNLTAATFCAACKYTAASNKQDDDIHDLSKPGYFASERELIEKVREETKVGDRRSPIAFLAEAADDTVYSAADIEDGIKKGLLTWDVLRDKLLQSEAAETAKELIEKTEHYIDDADVEFDHHEREEALAQMFRTNVIGAHVEAAAKEFASEYDAIMRGEYRKELLETGDTSELLAICKEIAIEHVYRSSSILRMPIKS